MTPKPKPKKEGRKSESFNEKFKKFTGLETRVPEGAYKLRKSLFDHQMDWFRKNNTGLYHQRVFCFTKNQSRELPEFLQNQVPENLESDSSQSSDEGSEEMEMKKAEPTPLFLAIKAILMDVVSNSEDNIYTKDPLTGIFLSMGDYGLLIIEAPEDLMSEFFERLEEIFADFWKTSKMFMMEDNIESYYFQNFTCKMCPLVFISEKFQPNLENDPYLMGKQHRAIAAKCRAICQCLTRVRSRDVGEEEYTEEDVGEEHRKKDCERIYSEAFKKVLPEIQRIDLVLNSQRFYPSMFYIAHMQREAPIKPEDDELFWPVINNMTPAGIFIKSKFDYNLTYPESNEAVQEDGQPGILVDKDEEEGDSEEGEGGEGGEKTTKE